MTASSTDVYEKLGVFYLGGSQDAPEQERVPLLYDSRDLLTHAVCVGMTGSGKTGLCVGLLEEAALDGVPAIVIDPKGDLGNLMLSFPALQAEDFKPWVSADDARRKDMSLDDYAAREADKWRSGLESWGQDADRIARLREAADFNIYTPGSSAGLQLSIIKSFSAPPVEVREDTDLFNERIATTVSSLLGLLGIDADPVQSREHILLSRILATEWNTGADIDIAGLIRATQNPPFDQVGVLDLDTFYPEKERFKLSMALNNLVASPGFASWMEGEPLDVDTLLFGPNGKPRISIISIAHLSDEERMFFVALLFNEVLGWTRSQSGSQNLRAILYMDEIYGYIPPVANPPSKKPLLTLMKQARAFGLGVVLATQNPVDLDYKALSNAGTWFIGRLQTAQDKARLLEALDGASANAGETFDKNEADRLISGLGSRVFLLHNVHEKRPVVFQTRWVMSYLRGPLVRDEIKQLMGPIKDARAVAAQAADAAQADSASTAKAEASAMASAAMPAPGSTPSTESPAPNSTTVAEPAAAPVVPEMPDVVVRYLPVTDKPPGATIAYRPALLGTGDVTFAHSKSGLVSDRPCALVATFSATGDVTPWSQAIAVTVHPDALETAPADGATFFELNGPAARTASYKTWRKALGEHLYRNEKLTLLRSPAQNVFSRANEDERAFRIRLSESARARRSEMRDSIRDKFESRIRKARERIGTAEARVEREEGQARRAKIDAGASFGTAILAAVSGRGRRAARGAATSMRKGSTAREQAGDVEEANQALAARQADLAELEREFEAETTQAMDALDAMSEPLESVEVTPRRKDLHNVDICLAWMPVACLPDGSVQLACNVRP